MYVLIIQDINKYACIIHTHTQSMYNANIKFNLKINNYEQYY